MSVSLLVKGIQEGGEPQRLKGDVKDFINIYMKGDVKDVINISCIHMYIHSGHESIYTVNSIHIHT